MDDRSRLFLSALLGLVIFGVLGGLFGAVAGAAYRAGGRAAGSRLGLAVLHAFERAGGRTLPPAGAGALVGGAEGLCFLGLVGAGLGLAAGWRDGGPLRLADLALGGSLLVLAAVLFGGLAYGLVHIGMRAVALLFAGAVGGGGLGWLAAGAAGLFYGAATGSLAGSLAGILTTGGSPPADG